MPSLILSFRSDTLVRDIRPSEAQEEFSLQEAWIHPLRDQTEGGFFFFFTIWNSGLLLQSWPVKAESTSSHQECSLDKHFMCVGQSSTTHVRAV